MTNVEAGSFAFDLHSHNSIVSTDVEKFVPIPAPPGRETTLTGNLPLTACRIRAICAPSHSGGVKRHDVDFASPGLLRGVSHPSCIRRELGVVRRRRGM